MASIDKASTAFVLQSQVLLCQPPTFWPLQGTFHAMASIVRDSGTRGLFRGWGPTVLANAPFSAVYYSFYTTIRARLEAVSMWPRQAD